MASRRRLGGGYSFATGMLLLSTVLAGAQDAHDIDNNHSLGAVKAGPLAPASAGYRNSAIDKTKLRGAAKTDPDPLAKEVMAELWSLIESPRADAMEHPAELLPDWYTAWNLVIQNQIDGLFSAVEELANTATTVEVAAEGRTHRRETDGDQGFKIDMIGDSTMRMQARVLGIMLLQRTTSDGRKQCFSVAEADTVRWDDIQCTGMHQGIGADGDLQEGARVVLTLSFTQVMTGCVPEQAVDADFVYFGCGLHFLQLIPARPHRRVQLEVWVHYERLLEDAVTLYRSGAGSGEGRVPIGEAFMTTHSIAVERFEGEYTTNVQAYVDRDESLLSTCRDVVGGLGPIEPDSMDEYEAEDVCTHGIFDDSGVVDLNRRAEGVMNRLGVPMVRGYDFTHGQAWATPRQDGRHYPAISPMEISSMLSEITTALRRKRFETAT